MCERTTDRLCLSPRPLVVTITPRKAHTEQVCLRGVKPTSHPLWLRWVEGLRFILLLQAQEKSAAQQLPPCSMG